MNCEIEFLPVGEASKAGDAIIVRYGTPQAYQLMIVDAGFSETGDEVVAHVRRRFGNQPVEHALLTHGDRDHAGGFSRVLAELDVKNFWFHRPWNVDATILPYFADKRLTVSALASRIRAEYDLLDELERIALKRRIAIRDPFAEAAVGPFWVLSPTRRMYQLLLPQFDRTPMPDADALRAASAWIGKGAPVTGLAALAAFLDTATAKLQSFFTESWATERLKDGAITSASNESSVVLYAQTVTGPMLLTGDAGVRALHAAADCAAVNGLSLQNFSFVQVPHHGSRSNVGPTILDRVIGPKQPEGTAPWFTAFVSAPSDDATHPRQMVVNAFLRRGAHVVATQGASVVHLGGFPRRGDYRGVAGLPFVARVEDYD